MARAKKSLDPEETLVIVISKTFTTAETMLNARTMRQWLWDAMGTDPQVKLTVALTLTLTRIPTLTLTLTLALSPNFA